MFVEDLTLYDDLYACLRKAQALMNSVAELFGGPLSDPVTRARASVLTDCGLDYLEDGQVLLD
jgi:hypothetical protein